MSCGDCCFPYSLCQCPVTITLGELARLRVSLATVTAERDQALQETTRLAKQVLAEEARAQKAAAILTERRILNPASQMARALEALRAPEQPALPAGFHGRVANQLRAVHRFCDFEDCDQEPDSTGFCEHHRGKAAP